MNKMTYQESISLSYIRVFAMFSIIICHLFQTYQMGKWSDIFNMGVQVFLVMSGYLYGYKQIDDWREWGRKRVKKIYYPYIVFLVIVIPFYVLFHLEALKWKALPFYFANLQGFRFLIGGGFGRIEGLRHVWFLTAIMCAYFITPILQKYKKHCTVALPILFILVIVAYCFAPSLRYVFVLSWVYLYAIGYLYVNLNKKGKKFYRVLCVVLLLFVLVLSRGDMKYFFSVNYRAIHDVVGIFVVIVGVFLLSKINGLKVPKFISFFDKWSFHIFLVHFIIIHGPFSLAHLTKYVGLNIIIMLMVTAVATFAFVKCLNVVDRVIFKGSFEKQK